MNVQSKKKKYPGDTPNSDLTSATPFDEGRMVDARFTGDMTPDALTMAEDRFQAVRYPYSPCHSTTMSNDSDTSGSTDEEDEKINLTDFDENEAETKRVEYADDMFELEQHFSSAREILLTEKLAALDENLSALNEDRFPDYAMSCHRFEREMQAQLENTDMWKEMHFENLKRCMECEKAVIDVNLAEEREFLLCSMRDELNTKVANIEAERELLKAKRAKLCDPTVGDLVRATIEAQTLLGGKKSSSVSKRTKNSTEKDVKNISSGAKSSRRPFKSPRNEDLLNSSSSMRHRLRQTINSRDDSVHHSSGHRKPTTVVGPYVVYLLRDQDIVDDWTEVTQALRLAEQRAMTNGYGNGGPTYVHNSSSSKRVRVSPDGKLYCDSFYFSIGDDISVTKPNSKMAERTQLWKISSSEIVLRNPDTAQQTKVPLSAIQSGRWILKRADSS